MVDSVLIDSVPIRIQRKTREKLKSIGSKGETYDDVINKLLKRGK